MSYSFHFSTSRRYLFRLALPLCLGLGGPAPAETALSLEAALTEALAGNPGLAEIRARAEAMAAVPDQEGALPDPNLSFSALNLPSSRINLRSEDMTMLETALSQELPFPGKLALKEKAARQEAEAAAGSVEEARLRLVRDVKIRWWQLFYMTHTLQITADSAALLEKLAAAARARYEAGAAPQQDWLQAQLEKARLDQQEAGHYAMHHSERSRLQALLGRHDDNGIAMPPDVDTRLPDVPSPGGLLALAEQSHPLLEQRRKTLEAARSRLALAEKGYYPDFNLGAGYGVRQATPAGDSRSDLLSFRLSMNLPLYAGRKQGRAVDQRQSEVLQAQYGLEDTLARLRSEIATAHAAYVSSRRQFALVAGDSVPLAQKAVDSLLASYQTGQAGFGDVIRGFETLYDYRLLYWQTLAQAHQALARLAFAAGREAL